MSVSRGLRAAAPEPAQAGPPVPRKWREWRVLVALGTALIVVLGGCAVPGLSPGPAEPGTEAETTPGSGTEWFWYQQGDRVASPAPYEWPASTSPSTTADSTSGTATPTASATPYCLPRLRADTMYWLNATPGVGQASVSWMSFGDPRIVEYRVAAVLQNRPGGSPLPPIWTTVAKPVGCQQVTATVTNLDSGSWYVFWLDVVVTTFPTGLREPMIGRSPAFQVL